MAGLLLIGLLGACVEEAEPGDPCPDLGDGGLGVVEGEVEDAVGTYCVDSQSFFHASTTIVSPPSWTGYLQFVAGFAAQHEGTTYACARTGFYGADLTQGTDVIVPETTSGWVRFDRSEDDGVCGSFEMGDVTLVSTELGSTLHLEHMAGTVGCNESCGQD